MNVISKLFILNLLFISLNSYAVTPEDFLYPDALEVECKDGSPMQEDLMYCVSRSYLDSDKKLNIEYKKRMKLLKGTEKEKLLESQRLWLKNRKYKCICEYSAAEGGREAPIYLIDCYARENYKRVKFLENYQ
ncbi:lysozyme inhibitor LprI family protein [Acinetobacter indicus]|uniref:lysozyme inhibitor LprI family protein n=1 Tax=Acinetobacter indicus TaxID=756892 RepID=UPI0039899494